MKQPPTLRAKNLVIATGAYRQRLALERENDFHGYGLSYCADCDGPLFRGREVAVVGSGNVALGEVLTLAPLVAKVHLIHFEKDFYAGAEAILKKKVRALKNVQLHFEKRVVALEGKELLESITLQDERTEKKESLPVEGLFVAIGMKANSLVFRELGLAEDGGEILNQNGQTKFPGVWVAGDVAAGEVKQFVTAAASGTRAALAIGAQES